MHLSNEVSFLEKADFLTVMGNLVLVTRLVDWRNLICLGRFLLDTSDFFAMYM